MPQTRFRYARVTPGEATPLGDLDVPEVRRPQLVEEVLAHRDVVVPDAVLLVELVVLALPHVGGEVPQRHMPGGVGHHVRMRLEVLLHPGLGDERRVLRAAVICWEWVRLSAP